MKRIIMVLLVALFFVGCDSKSATKDVEEATDIVIEELETIVYKEVDGQKLEMDIYHPLINVYDRSPVVLYFHGGSWVSGDKNSVTANGRSLLVNELRTLGYTIISANYRLLDGDIIFPSNLEDTSDCFEFIKGNADTYNWDENNIGIWGNSAGGHLALLTSYGVDADYVVNYSGPTNLSKLVRDDPMKYASKLEELIGIKGSPGNMKEVKELLVTYSPITYVDKDVPPTFIVHGTEDRTVPVEQGHILYNSLSGEEHSKLIVEGGEHGLLKQGALDQGVIDSIIIETIYFIQNQYN